MYSALLIIYLVVSIALIAFILLQQGKGADAGASFGGGASGTVFGSAGAEGGAEYHARRHPADGCPIDGVFFMLGIHTGEGGKHHDGKGSADGDMLGIGMAAYALQLQCP